MRTWEGCCPQCGWYVAMTNDKCPQCGKTCEPITAKKSKRAAAPQAEKEK